MGPKEKKLIGRFNLTDYQKTLLRVSINRYGSPHEPEVTTEALPLYTADYAAECLLKMADAATGATDDFKEHVKDLLKILRG